MPGYNCMQVVARDLGVEDKLPMIKNKMWMGKRQEWLKKAAERAAKAGN